jgi:hypothetical protein
MTEAVKNIRVIALDDNNYVTWADQVQCMFGLQGMLQKIEPVKDAEELDRAGPPRGDPRLFAKALKIPGL